MATTVFDVLRSKLNVEITRYKESIINGDPANYEVYREKVGVLYGLAMAFDQVDQLEKAMEQDDE